jgi:hypothetical protein
MDSPRPAMAFVVRVITSNGGQLNGTVERVRTGEKRPFQGIEAVSRVIEQMARGEADDPTIPTV